MQTAEEVIQKGDKAIRFNPLPVGEGAVVDEFTSHTTAGEGNKTISRISPISWLSPLRSLRSDNCFVIPYLIRDLSIKLIDAESSSA